MSNQIVITSGAKLRDLDDVIIGTDGILSSVAFNVANGVPRLDENGKILVSQLPNSVMEFKGVWNAATNTPTLVNGTGNAGDVWLCNVAGTVNFGAGPIAFAVGDYAVYTGTVWARSSGATGTVTSVGVSRDGNALAITGSPVTSSGTINLGFSGNSSQYINGAGNLTTFPTIISQATTLVTEVYNETGATLTKGTIVYINGGHGNLPTVTKAIATSDATSAQTYGVINADLTNMNNGYVTVIGSLGDLDTQAYANGTQLYLSGTTAGAWTSTKPSAPIHLVYVGIVVRSHPTQGVVEIKIQNGYELNELHDVQIIDVANNDGIFYDSATSLWKNKTIGEVLGYTPANNSEVVHLAGTETITGAKTFSGYTTFTSTVDLTNGLTFRNSGYSLLLQPPTLSVNRTVTLPNGTGTLALTSDLSSYLPLSGGTLTGATFFDSGIRYKDNVVPNSIYGGYVSTWFNINGTKNSLGLSSSATSPYYYTYDFPNASGTIALTSDLTGGTVTSVAMTVPTGLSIAGSPITSSGTLAVTFASGYSIPTTASQTNWDTAYTNRITSLTTTGTSGAATLVSNVLNIPQYQAALTNPVTGTGSSGRVTYWDGSSSITSNANFYFDSTYERLRIGTSAFGSSTTTKLLVGDIMLGGSAAIAQFNGFIRVRDRIAIQYDGDVSLEGTISCNGSNSLNTIASFEAASFIKTGGTSSQFLKANGSVDSNTYLTTSSAASTYVPYTGASANVNLGAYGLQAGNRIITGRTTSDAGGSFVMNIGNGTNNVGDANSTTIYSDSAGRLMLVYKNATQTKIVGLSASIDNTQTYLQWPSSDGTIALTSQIPSLTGYVTGSGASGRVAFWNSSSSISGNDGFYYDSGNEKVRIATSDFGTTQAKLLVGTYLSNGSSAIAQFNGFIRIKGQIIIHNDADINLSASISCNGSNSISFDTATVTAGAFVKSGGTSSQFLKADGSVTTLTNPVTGTGAANRIAYWDGTSSITSSSNLTWDGTQMGLGTSPVSNVKLTINQSGDNYFLNMINNSSSLFSVVAQGTAVSGYGIMYVSKAGSDRIILNANGESSISAGSGFSSSGNYGLYVSNGFSPSSGTFNNGGTWAASNNYQAITWGSSSVTVNSGAVIAGFNAVNRNIFNTAGVSVSVSQSGTGIRAISAFQVLQQTGGTNSGTISHGAGVFIQGIYPTNTSTTTFTNYYGLLINALDEWQGSLPYISISNRWGIYQAGSSDKNYFAGKIGIGIQPTLPLQVVGTGPSNSIMTNTSASLGNANALNVGDDGTNTMIGVGNSGTKLIVLKRNAGVYAEMVRFHNDGSTQFQENSSGVSIYTVGEIILANAKPLRSYTTTGGTFRLISMESDNQIYIAGNGGNVFMNGGGGLGINNTNGIPSAAKLVLGNYLTGYDGSSAIAQINGFIRIQGSIIFHNSANVAQQVGVYCNGANTFYVDGTLAKSSGSFRIDHPLESKKGYDLVHSFIEGPKADLIYRGRVTLVNGKASINIDSYTTMTEGTFVALCGDVQCFTTNEQGWDLIKGKVEGNILTIESQNKDCQDEISWIVIGERHDKHMIEANWTDSSGRVILEPLTNKKIKNSIL